MDHKTYYRLSHELFNRVQDKLDDYEEILDYDSGGGKLEISLEQSGEKIVINTQQAIHEMWLAGNGRGWHFQYDEDRELWFAHAEQEEFYDCLSRLLASRIGQPVSFS